MFSGWSKLEPLIRCALKKSSDLRRSKGCATAILRRIECHDSFANGQLFN
jgi:hypothetical protein